MQKIQMTSFVCIDAIDNFYLHFCNWQLLTLLNVSHLTSIMHYCKLYFVYALLNLLPLLTLIFTLYTILLFTNLIMQHHNWQFFCTLLEFITLTYLLQKWFLKYYSNSQLFHEMWKMTTFVCTIPIDNFCMHFWKKQLLLPLLQMTKYKQ